MKRFYSLLSLAALLALAVVPAFAQEGESTIADIIVSSTQAETPEFTSLLAAATSAEPSVLGLLANPDANVTVFAPNDDAFGAELEALGVTRDELLADSTMLTEILSYHIVPGTFDSASLAEIDGAFLGTRLYDAALELSSADGSLTVNGVAVVSSDIRAVNGIVHVIDGMLIPPPDANETAIDTTGDHAIAPGEDVETSDIEAAQGDLVSEIMASVNRDPVALSTLLSAVQAADPVVIEELTGVGPYTLFAPTDAAFEAALQALGITADELLADTEALTTILAYHIVPGYIGAEAAIELAGTDSAKLATALNGTAVELSFDGTTLLVNGATVSAAGVPADNGIIHIIDAVLIPPA